MFKFYKNMKKALLKLITQKEKKSTLFIKNNIKNDYIKYLMDKKIIIHISNKELLKKNKIIVFCYISIIFYAYF